MVGYKADGTVVEPRPTNPNARQPVKAGQVPRTSPTPEDLASLHRVTAESTAQRQRAAYLTSPDLAVAILARLDALEAQVAALEAAGATG